MSRRHTGWILVTGTLIAFCGGCSRFPASPEQPEIDPQEAGEAAIAEYDANGDGRLDDAEIKSSPPLQGAKKRIDANGDGVLTAEEIASRVEYWLNCGTTIIDGTTRITLNGRPLEGATVTYVPEEFLGPAFTPCEGVTNNRGIATIEGPDATFPGIYLGLYRVKVSKLDKNGRETIPSRWNTKTELGYEATDDIPGVGNIEFHLGRR